MLCVAGKVFGGTHGPAAALSGLIESSAAGIPAWGRLTGVQRLAATNWVGEKQRSEEIVPYFEGASGSYVKQVLTWDE